MCDGRFQRSHFFFYRWSGWGFNSHGSTISTSYATGSVTSTGQSIVGLTPTGQNIYGPVGQG